MTVAGTELIRLCPAQQAIAGKDRADYRLGISFWIALTNRV